LRETAASVIQKGSVEKLAVETSRLMGTAFNDGTIITISGSAEANTGESAGAETLDEPSSINAQTTVVAVETCETAAHEGAIVAEVRDGSVSVGGVMGQRPEEPDAISLDGTVMSIDGSSEGSPDHSTCGSSVSASESRKRAADASPEHARKKSSRRDFPGRVTRSAAGCRVYISPITDVGEDCPGCVLNVNGTFTERITVGQEEEVVMEIEEEVPLIIVGATEVSVDLESPARVVPTPAVSNVTPTGSPRRLFTEPIVVVNPRIGSMPVFDSLLHTEPGSDPSAHTVNPMFSTPGTDTIYAPTQVIVLVDDWGHDIFVINKVCELIETMPRPWSAYRAFEAASTRFLNIERGALRLAETAVLMGQRRCVNRLTNARWMAGTLAETS